MSSAVHFTLNSYFRYLTLIQFAFYSVFSRIELSCDSGKLFGQFQPKVPMKTYLILALATLTTMGFSNASLGYLNYPTQVIFKCCKLIPVLIGGILIQGKKYGGVDFAAAALMCVGLIVFTLADSKVLRLLIDELWFHSVQINPSLVPFRLVQTLTWRVCWWSPRLWSETQSLEISRRRPWENTIQREQKSSFTAIQLGFCTSVWPSSASTCFNPV